MKKIVVSACLMGRNCKYNGGNNYNEAIVSSLENKEIIEVCPEVAGGLPTPRVPVELIDNVAINREGVNVDAAFRQGVSSVMAQLRGQDIACALLQSRSPSCGVNQIYDGTFTGQLKQGQGLFAQALCEAEIPVVDAEEWIEEKKGMQIKWLGHACFKVTCDGHSIVFDPFQPGSVPGLKDVKETADCVRCSHGHFDHNCAEAVMIPANTQPEPFKITTIDVAHDDQNGALRGRTDITIVEIGGHKIAHFGDLGCNLTAEQKLQLSGLEVAFVPVGGYYTIDGKQAAKLVNELHPKHVIPMHYSSDHFGFDEISHVDVFTECFAPDEILWLTGAESSLAAFGTAKVIVFCI